MRFLLSVAVCALVFLNGGMERLVWGAGADKPANNMEIIHKKLKAVRI